MNRKLRKKMQSLQPNICQATGESQVGKQAPDQLQIFYHFSRKTIKRRIKERKEERVEKNGEGKREKRNRMRTH